MFARGRACADSITQMIHAFHYTKSTRHFEIKRSRCKNFRFSSLCSLLLAAPVAELFLVSCWRARVG